MEWSVIYLFIEEIEVKFDVLFYFLFLVVIRADCPLSPRINSSPQNSQWKQLHLSLFWHAIWMLIQHFVVHVSLWNTARITKRRGPQVVRVSLNPYVIWINIKIWFIFININKKYFILHREIPTTTINSNRVFVAIDGLVSMVTAP